MTGAERTGSGSSALDAENPWPGLEAFDENGQDYFHGRGAEAEELLRRVADSPLTVLFGKSGLGKTSLLKAGLFPRLRTRHMLPIYVRLIIRADAPSFVDQLAGALKAAVAADQVDAPPLHDGSTLWAYLHRRPFEFWSRQNFPLVPVFVLDQFEELFTLGERTPEVVERIRIEFSDLAENRIPADLAARIESDAALAATLDLRAMPYKVVVSLREDYLPELEAWRQTTPSLGRVRVRLLAMRVDQALTAVTDTAPHLMDAHLASRIVEFVSAAQASQAPAHGSGKDAGKGQREIEPALLSLFCRGLNEQRKLQKKSRFDDALLDGAKQGIISDYYRSCVDDLPEAVSRFIETQLITEKGFRNSYSRDDAVPAHLEAEQLHRLVDRRLLRLEERHGTERIELTHDLLTTAVVEHRTQRRARDAEHERSRRAAEERSRLEAENARQRRRVRFAAIVAAVCVAFAAAAGYFWWRATAERARAESALSTAEARQLASQSILTGSTNPIRALELALRASERAPVAEAEFALRLALANSRLRATLPAPPGVQFIHADVSPAGDHVVLVGDDGSVEIRSIPALALQHRRRGGSPALAAFFGTGESQVAVVAKDFAISIWSPAVETERSIASRLVGGNGWVLKGHSRNYLVRGQDGNVVLLNLGTGHPTPLRPCSSDLPMAAAIDPPTVLLAYRSVRVLCDARSGRQLPQLTVAESHYPTLMEATFTVDGKRLVTSSSEEVVRIWNTETGQEVAALRGFTATPQHVAFNGPRHVLVGVGDGVAEEWRLSNSTGGAEPHERVLQLTGTQEAAGAVFSVAGGESILTIHRGSVRIWHGTSRTLSRTVEFPEPVEQGILTAAGGSVVVGRSGGFLATPPAGEHRVIAPEPKPAAPIMQALGHDRRHLLQAWADGLVRVWDVERLERLIEIKVGHALSTASWASPSCDGVRDRSQGSSATEPEAPECAVATLGLNGSLQLHTLGPAGATARTWNLPPIAEPQDKASGRPIPRRFGVLSPDRTKWITTGDTEPESLILIDLSSPAAVPKTRVPGLLLEGWPFPAGGLTVIATARFRDTYVHGIPETLATLTLKGHPTGVTSASVSPNGSQVLTWSADWTARLWEAKTGSLLSTMRGHTNAVTSAMFRRDGALIATASEDSSVRVWDPVSGAQLFRFELPPGEDFGRILDFRGTEILYWGVTRKLLTINCEPCLPLADIQRLARGRIDTTVR